jgi:hypothetical protein
MWKTLLATQIVLLVLPAGAMACSPLPPWFLTFKHMSVELPNSSVLQWPSSMAREFGSLNKKCVTVDIDASATDKEKAEGGERLAAERAEILRKVFLDAGLSPEQVRVRLGGNLGTATFSWTYAPNRTRCDPRSRYPMYSSCGVQLFTRCYMELLDGTVCKSKVEPDMNPSVYSVDSDGNPLDGT